MDSENAQVKKWIILSAGWDGCPFAYHIQNEGGKAYLGQVQSFDELKIDKEPEEPEDKEERLKQYDGMVRKETAKRLVAALKKVSDKDNYFIFCDQNQLWFYAEQLVKAGFTKGLFPTEDDFNFEKGREEAMEFVEQNYPYVQIIPHEKYKTVEEARAAVEASDVPLVIQSEGDYVATICPVDDVEQNHIEILAALDKHEKEYAQGEIILKEKLVKPVEITPQIVFWDGVPVYTSIDIETKNIGAGENNGNQVGCGTNLIIRTELDDEINKIAFPEKIYEMAKERKGIFIWDISLYFTDSGIYFGEFCSNRFGYDASMTEMAMAGGTIPYFTAIMNGENPLKNKFGAAVRVFNLNRSKETEINVGNDEHTWLYEVTKKDDKLVSVGDCWDLGVITGAGDSIEDAVKECYKNYDQLTFKEKYVRPKDDFLAEYPTSIINRYNAVVGTYFDGEPFDVEKKGDPDLHKMAKDIEELSSTFSSTVDGLHEQLTSLKEIQDKSKTTKTKFKAKLKDMLHERR